MNRRKVLLKSSLGLILVLTMLLTAVLSVSARPIMPMVAWGIAYVNGQPAEDGTLVEARIGGEVVASGYTYTEDGEKGHYVLDIPGDTCDVVDFLVLGIMSEETRLVGKSWRPGEYHLDLHITKAHLVAEITEFLSPTKVGYLFTLTAVVTNSIDAQATATDVSASVSVEPAGAANIIGPSPGSVASLAPGESQEFSWDVTCTQAGVITLTVTPEGKTPAGVDDETIAIPADNLEPDSVTITVNPPLSITCDASPNPTKVDHPVVFTATVEGGVPGYSFLWTFGDGGTSTLQNPTHTYTAAGTYTTMVTVTDSLGNMENDSVVVEVRPPLSVTCDATPNPTKVGHAVNFTSSPSGGVGPYSFSWDFGDGVGTSTEQNPVYIYTAAGTYTATVTVADSLGAEGSCSVVMDVRPHLSIVTTELPDGHVSEPYAATLEVAGGVEPYSWSLIAGSLPDGLELSGSGIISGTPEVWGEFTFTVQVTDALNNTDTKELSITVHPFTIYLPIVLKNYAP